MESPRSRSSLASNQQGRTTDGLQARGAVLIAPLTSLTPVFAHGRRDSLQLVRESPPALNRSGVLARLRRALCRCENLRAPTRYHISPRAMLSR